MGSGWVKWVAVGFFSLLAPAVVLGQTTGSISGVVKDTTGGVLPGVEVTLTHVATGQAREVVTDDEGRYSATNLAIGTYEVKAVLAGFQASVHRGIVLTIGREAVVDMVMQVGEISEQVTVTGDAPLVETRTSQVSGLVELRQIQNLPLNGRDFSQLVTLQAGVATPPVTRNAFGGSRQKLSIAGGRPSQNTFLLDGTDINSPRWNATPGGAAGVLLGVETVSEFTVLTNAFSTEYGNAGAGVISSVTKSGTNEIHGSAFWYHRNSALDAKNFFDDPDEPIPPFRRHQFGGTVGGPILKNKAFFFGSYEGLRQALGITSTLRVPSPNARRGFLVDPANPGQFRQVAVNPASARWLDAYPLPNSTRVFGPDIGEAIVARTQPTREDYFLAKIDYNFSNDDSFFARYTLDDSEQTTPAAMNLEGFRDIYNGRNQYTTLEHKHIFNSELLNVLRFGVNRNNEGSFQEIPSVPSEFSLIPGKPLGNLVVTGLSDMGTTITLPFRFISNVFDLNDTVTWSKGEHSFKLGGQFKRIQMQHTGDLRFAGQVVFSSLENFLRGTTLRLSGALPGASSYRGWRQSYGAWFVQDDWRVRPNLTFNLGVRWEKMSVATEVNGKTSTLRNPLTDPEFIVGDPWFDIQDTLHGFAPRVGFAWDPSGDGKTAVRGGAGIFYDQIKEINFATARLVPPFVREVVVNGPPWPFPLGGTLTTPLLSPTIVEFNATTPLTYQWNLQVQRQLFTHGVVTVAYLGSRGLHLGSVGCPNCPKPSLADRRFFWEAGLSRPNPAFGYIRYLAMDADSYYHGLQVKAEKRYSDGFGIQGNFTWSKSLDNGSGQAGSEVAGVGGVFTRPNWYDKRGDRSRSIFDFRRSLIINFSYELPVGPGKRFGSDLSGAGRSLFAGWQIHGITQVSDGTTGNIFLNFNRSRSRQDRDIADRPDLRPGASNNPVLGDPAKYYDPTAFVLQPAGFPGNLGRNALTLPGYANLDLSLVKHFVGFRETDVEFRAEFFNLLNRPNFAAPNLEPLLANGNYNPSAGVIGETRSTSRQIQFALRVNF